MISYDKIFSRFLSKLTDFNIASLSDIELYNLGSEWLHSTAATIRLRPIFKTLVLNDEESFVTFELVNSIDEYSDENFAIEVFALGMSIGWLQMHVDSILNVAPMIGGKEEKKLIDNHKSSIERLKTLKIELKKTMRDYGYLYTVVSR